MYVSLAARLRKTEECGGAFHSHHLCTRFNMCTCSFANQSVGCLPGGWLAGWLADSLAGWLAGWLADWLLGGLKRFNFHGVLSVSRQALEVSWCAI